MYLQCIELPPCLEEAEDGHAAGVGVEREAERPDQEVVPVAEPHPVLDGLVEEQRLPGGGGLGRAGLGQEQRVLLQRLVAGGETRARQEELPQVGPFKCMQMLTSS